MCRALARICLPFLLLVTTACSSTAVGRPASASSAPTASASARPVTIDAKAARQAVVQLYGGGVSATGGRLDCLTDVATCPLSSRLRARFADFAGSSAAHNAGSGAQDPVCRGCATAPSDVSIVSVNVLGSSAIVLVHTTAGGAALDLAVLEVGTAEQPLVDDILCVKDGRLRGTTSLYAVSHPGC